MTKTLEQKNEKGPCFGMRHVQALLCFFGMIVIFISRLNIAVSVVAMTNAARGNAKHPIYNWSESEKGYIFSSFYWGSLLMQLPSGYFVQRFGVKINLFACVFASGALSLLVPLCVPRGGWRVVCLLRFIHGLFQAGTLPAMQSHMAKWSPPAERNRLSGFVHTGVSCGIVLALGMSGLIAASSLGWPGIFYSSAILCFIWCLTWALFGANDVTVAKFITQTEREYIETSLQSSIHFNKKRLPIPWRAILTSPPFYAILFVRSAECWGYITLLTEMPAYMNGVLQLHFENNALFSALPYFTSWMMTYVFMMIADVVMKRKLLSVTALRKCFNSYSLWVPAAGMIWVGFLDVEHRLLAIILITFSVGMTSAIIFGSVLSRIEIAPNHTGIIVAIVDVVSGVVRMLAPIFVGAVVKDEQNREQWQIVFNTTAAIFCIGDLIFLIWGTSEKQPWNDPDYVRPADEAKPFTMGINDAKLEADFNRTHVSNETDIQPKEAMAQESL